MKKTLFTILIMVLACFAGAQTVLNETFSGGTFPPSGWTIDAQAGNWSSGNSANAGGSAPEAHMSWSPQFNTTTRLISPVLDMAGTTTALLQFRQMIDHYGGSYQIGVATRSNGGTWTNAWTRTVSSSYAAEQVSIPISDANIGSANFQFCIFFSGSSYNLNDWFIDDVVLTVPAGLDAAVSSIQVPTYFTGTRDVKAGITNMGLTNLSSFRLSWQIDDNEIHSDNITAQNISLGNSYNHTFSDQINLEPGIYTLKIWVDQVNGNPAGDDVTENDTLTKTLRIPVQTVPRKPFMEEFTSSTCGPCASFNNSVLNPFIAQHGEEVVLVKYQMNWPGSGDPYYTEEGGVRRNYYGVAAVPMFYVDGKNVATSSSAVNTAFNNSLTNPAFVEITGYYTIDGSNVGIDADITAYTDIDNATLHVVIFEGITTENKRTNGETEFHHVMMRLLPDGSGSQAALQTGIPQKISHNVDMTGTNVEEMDDLFVAIFLQDNVTKDVFQAAYATLSGAIISSDPENLSTGVSVSEPMLISFSHAVRQPGGAELTNENVSEYISLELTGSNREAVEFSAEINPEKNMITVTPASDLIEASVYQLTVLPLENYSGTATYTYTSTFTTETGTGSKLQNPGIIEIHPNPASSYVNIGGIEKLQGDVLITVTDYSGKIVLQQNFAGKQRNNLSIPVNNLSEGVYLLTVRSSNFIESCRVIVTK